MRIKVMADYDSAPLWWDQPDRVGDVRPEELGLSDELSAELWAWSSAYNNTLNLSDPKNSGFACSDDERLFREQGAHLTKLVAAELGPEAMVRFFV